MRGKGATGLSGQCEASRLQKIYQRDWETRSAQTLKGIERPMQFYRVVHLTLDHPIEHAIYQISYLPEVHGGRERVSNLKR